MAKRLVIKDKYKGILFIIMAGFFFSLMTFFVRLSGDLPTMQKALEMQWPLLWPLPCS